ncbi:MAG: hypothetical protein SGBAC_012666 [Bacillariaceae sp.]
MDDMVKETTDSEQQDHHTVKTSFTDDTLADCLDLDDDLAYGDDDHDDDDDDDASAITVPDITYSRDIFLPRGPPPERDTKVKFHSVEVREYPIIPGDHPSCRLGPPLTIGWEHNKSSCKISPMDDFENLRGRQRCRNTQELMISSFERRNILKKLGFSKREIGKASTQASKVRNQRNTTTQREKKMATFRQWKGRTLGWMSCRKIPTEATAFESPLRHSVA